ncbi:hypothetical protein MUK42_18856 [Musa troglodytarum]|uniref:Uncharacterized protein n=1 Tax=Musa troglodytarum TaxID=320322 RepID=A0A9E7IBN3_9LILI|nr:hypothetical protein MUK42_18856 [Musa troglodytarum]
MTRKVELFGHSSRVLYLAGSPLGGVVASTVEDEALRLWNSCTEKFGGIKLTTHFHISISASAKAIEGSGPITSISWSPDSSFFAFGNSVLALVDPATGQDVNVTEDDENLTPVLSFAWRSNSILTVGSSDGTVVDYDFRKDDTSICFYNGHRRGVCSLKWSDNRRYLASGGHDKLVHIWDACMPVSHHHPRRHQWLHRIATTLPL